MTLGDTCAQCGGTLNSGPATCPFCGELRAECKGISQLIAPERGTCVHTGLTTDLILPNGDYIAAAVVLEFLDKGWLDSKFRYTKAFARQEIRPEAAEPRRTSLRPKWLWKIGVVLILMTIIFAVKCFVITRTDDTLVHVWAIPIVSGTLAWLCLRRSF